MSDPVFVVTLEGAEAAGGPFLTVLAFACAPDEAAAEQAGADELRRLGWTEVRVVRTGELTDPQALPADFSDAYANALRYGCALIIYDEP